MKTGIALVLSAAVLGGCTSISGPEFSWYHPAGGEHLFAFDADECEVEVLARGKRLGSDIDGPFFKCMHDRGYYLVSETGVLQGPSIASSPAQSQSVTQK